MKQKNYEITYSERDGILYPDLALPEQSEVSFGKHGQMRLDFLRKHRKGTHTTLLVEGKPPKHLAAVDSEANEMLEILIEQLAKQRGIGEDLKARDQLHWVREINLCKKSAEEIVLREVIYR